jgi:putative oxidoreductase
MFKRSDFMASVKDILLMRFVPERSQWGIAIVRVMSGLVIFLRHGLEKTPPHWVEYWHRFARNNVDPLGIGPHATLIVSIISDVFCSLLIVVGLGTRWAAIWCFGTVLVAWIFQLHASLLARTEDGKSGEHMLLYLAGLACVILAGPGAASLDRLIGRRRAD